MILTQIYISDIIVFKLSLGSLPSTDSKQDHQLVRHTTQKGNPMSTLVETIMYAIAEFFHGGTDHAKDCELVIHESGTWEDYIEKQRLAATSK